MTLEISEDDRAPGKTWLWPTFAGFTDAPITHRCLLGRIGFLQFFNVKFFGDPPAVEIEPNETFYRIGGRIE